MFNDFLDDEDDFLMGKTPFPDKSDETVEDFSDEYYQKLMRT